jgi:hypothetical protein
MPPENPYALASWETNYGKYTGVLGPEQHNWGGIKTATGWSDTDPKHHQTFSSDEQGALAVIQHLYRYGGKTTLPAGETLVDPRYQLVTKTTTTIEGLGGAWAPNAQYGENVAGRVVDMRSFANDGPWKEQPMEAQIPGFRWYPAATTHYTRGRAARVRGGAQHYTAGVDSLAWLTSTSGRENPDDRVSATFLVRRNATLEFRGWQLVGLEDTAWTTAFANPYTVSVEYEHLASQDIPDSDYAVLGQTWADIEQALLERDLGRLDVVQGHKVWVNKPSLPCPDGIDMARVVSEWQARRGKKPELPPGVGDASARFVPETSVWLQWGFKAFWESNPDAIKWLGWPVENERGVGTGLSIQRFERGILVYDASQPEGWRVTALPLSRYAEYGLSAA